jgi:hypothetical protein
MKAAGGSSLASFFFCNGKEVGGSKGERRGRGLLMEEGGEGGINGIVDPQWLGALLARGTFTCLIISV